MDDPIWINKELVVAIHKRQLSEHGGADGVRDEGLLDSALAHPRHLFAYEQPTIPTLAAAYAFGIAKNNAFIDGNKRTAAVVCETFLALNGYSLDSDDAEMYPLFLGLAAGSVSEGDLIKWLSSQASQDR